MTCTARGLFVYDDTNKVAARSYSKFFNLGEVKTSTEDYILNNWVGTVNVYGKANGYLGIISVDTRTNEFIFASKSRTDMDFAKNLERIFNKKVSKAKQNALRDWLTKDMGKHNGNAYSLVVEVIDPVNDSHICKYNQENIGLLDVFVNDYAEKTLGYDAVCKLGQLTMLPVKIPLEPIKDTIALKMALDELSNTKEHCEGFVLEGHNKSGEVVRVKIKTPWYLMWKYYRGHGSFERKWDEMGFLTAEQREYACKIWKRANQLIALRKGEEVLMSDIELFSDAVDNCKDLVLKNLCRGWQMNIPRIIELVENYHPASVNDLIQKYVK